MNDEKTQWSQIYIVAVLFFLYSLQYSIYSASTWPFLQEMDPLTTENFLAVIFFLNNLGTVLCSPMMAFISHKILRIRPLLMFGFFLTFLGNCLYFITPMLRHHRKFSIAVARLLMGCGLSTLGLLFSFVSSISSSKNRSRVVSCCLSGLAFGMIIGPGLQMTFVPLAPAVAAATSNLCAIATAFLLIKEKRNYKLTSTEAVPVTHCVLPAYDRLAVGLCFLSKAATNFIMANFELIGTPFAMVMFALDKPTVIQYWSSTMAANCSISFVIFILSAVYNIDKKVRARIFVVGAFACFGGLYLLTFSWPFLPGKLITYNSTLSSSVEQVGCNTDYLNWCESTKPVNIYVFFTTYILVLGFCYTLLEITVNTLFTQIIGPRHQTIEHGYFQMAGGSSKLIAPICLGSLYTSFGPRGAWSLEILIIAIVLTLWVIMWKRMIPFEDRVKCKCGCTNNAQAEENGNKKCCSKSLDEHELKTLIPKQETHF